MVAHLLQAAIDGVLMGGTYGLLAAGLALIFGVMHIVNFAQAEFMMLGMYLSFIAWGTVGMDPLLVIPLAVVLFFALGYGVHRGLVRYTIQGESHAAQVVLTLGIALVLQNIVLLTFSATPRLVITPYTHSGWRVAELYIGHSRLIAFVGAVMLAGISYLFLHYTKLGRAIRAVSDDSEAARYMAVNVAQAHAIAFGIGIALTGIGGVLLSTSQPMSPFIGLDFVVLMFAAVVLGGLGSMYGALVAGLLIGVIHSVSQVFTSAAVSEVWVFGLLLVTLYVRPAGLFGRAMRQI